MRGVAETEGLTSQPRPNSIPTQVVTDANPVLEVRDLVVQYRAFDDEGAPVQAVRGVSFHLSQGEALGIVGESGSGKTTIGLAIMRLLPPAAMVVSGQILIEGRDILKLPQDELDRVRWKTIAMAFQGAQNALNPVQRVLDQITEPMMVHDGLGREAARMRARELLDRVGIDPRRGDGYPHEFSGGMLQRAVIAMALACQPRILIADEPGTAQDVVVQGQILELLLDLQKDMHLATLIISHDLSVIRFLTNRCLVVYAGDLAETGPTNVLFGSPKHPYLEMLVRSFPSLRDEVRHLDVIPDRPPDLADLPTGCTFHPRCPVVMPICRTEAPPDFEVSADHFAACWRNADRSVE